MVSADYERFGQSETRDVDVDGYRAKLQREAKRLDALSAATGPITEGRGSGIYLALSYLDEFTYCNDDH